MLLLAVSLLIMYLIRYIAYYIAFMKTGWLLIDKKGIATISFISLLFGVFMPASAFDFVGILLRLLIISVFIVVIFEEDVSSAFGMALVASVVEIILGFVISIFVGGLMINPFAVP